MRRIDIGIGAVLIIAVVFSVLGIASYERESGLRTFDVEWTSQTAPISVNRDPYVSGTQLEFTRNEFNLTQVAFNVTVTGNGPRASNTNVRVTVAQPNGASESKDGSITGNTAGNVRLAFQFPFATQPTNETVQANSQEEAEQTLNGTHGRGGGRGDWQITVTITGGNPPPLPAETYRVSVAGEAHWFSANATLSTPDVGR